MRHILYIVVFSIFMISCEETVILDTDQVEPKLVIHSHITNEMKHHIVRLSLSVDFYFDDKPPIVEDAVVIISNVTTGEVHEFTPTEKPNGNNDNYYYSDEPFEGVVGHTYELQVLWAGEEYVARETMLPVATITSLSHRVSQSEYQNPSNEGYYFEILLSATEPQETEDYYLFKFYRNDSLIFARQNEIYFTDDKLLGEEIKNLPVPVYYSAGDEARVKMFSITRQAFIYLNDVMNNLNNDSGMFSPPPANPRNNISNGALGYFMVSAVSEASHKID